MSTGDWMIVLDELSGSIDGVEALNRLLQQVRDEAYDDGFRDGQRQAGMQERRRENTEDTSSEPRTVAVRVASLVGSDGLEIPVEDAAGGVFDESIGGDGDPSIDHTLEMLT